MKRITADLLAEKGARCGQLDEFRERFPNGLDPATVMPEEVAGLNVGWAVWALLGTSAWKAYWKAVSVRAREAFVEARSTAREAYEEARVREREAFVEAPATAWEAYEEAKVRAWGTYEEAKARAAIAVFREYWQEEEERRAGP